MKLTLRKAHVLAKQIQQYVNNVGSINVDYISLSCHDTNAEQVHKVSADAANATREHCRILQNGLVLVQAIREKIGQKNHTESNAAGKTVNQLLADKATAEATMRLMSNCSVPVSAPTLDELQNSDQAVVYTALDRHLRIGGHAAGPVVSNFQLADTGAGLQLQYDMHQTYMIAKRELAEVIDDLAFLNNSLYIELNDEQVEMLNDVKQHTGIV